ncbi:MAG: cytidine deaminase [Chitinophagales bacterium]|nr:cytidine deaminase [Chitinophagales bacterium]MBP8893718.1 cytidine deaminase [Saprospiraceae bacterium]MBP9189608.1 cytidine deaminase [Chitinophagales bacterium]MBP9549050.1 cytidine deaminase [Chitinophagales bacterium]MBP9705231.1 cytidine deaminase [Chitinophagales bacterium]
MKSEIEIKIVITKMPFAMLNDQDQELLTMATLAINTAYAPYSNYRVGAALRLQNTTIISGSNQENAAYPSGLCAERVAIFSARSQYPKEPIHTIAITTEKYTDHPIAPCGSCRQVISEYEIKQQSPIRIILGHIDGIVWISESMENLLPLPFMLDEK